MASPVSVRVNFEIGHEASIRTKRTVEGFTHDWEIFLRGADNTDISPFVDKVVFLLHETFQKPKRVLKEPPYSVKESGYAGFNLPIEIYLKNRDEPKKLRFNYDLNLQQTGPAILHTEKERYIFQNPSEEFRKKLLRGGGVVINYPPSSDHERDSRDCFSDDKHGQLIGKPKLSGDILKKHRTKEEMPRPSTNFKDLFGPPQKTIKASPDPKKVSPNIKPEKRDKEKISTDKDKKSKHEHKDKSDKCDKLKMNKEDCTREDKSSKSYHSKDADKFKEKVMKRPSDRRSPSPASPAKKRCISPKLSVSPRRTASPGVVQRTHKEDSKSSKPTPPQTDTKKSSQKTESHNVAKSDKKHKKDKKSHDKERERSPKKEHKKDKESQRESATKDSSRDSTKFKEDKEKSNPPKESHLPTQKEKQSKSDRPFNKFSIENMLKDPKESTSKNSTADKSNNKPKTDAERKHKHKKKDKKRDESRERHKEHGRDKKHYKPDKQSSKDANIPEQKPTTSYQSNDKGNSTPKDKEKPFKEKMLDTASPISVDTNSQSSSKSSRNFKSKDGFGSTMNLSDNSDSESDTSLVSEGESPAPVEVKPTIKIEPKEGSQPPRMESFQAVDSEPVVKVEKPSKVKEEKSSPGPSQKEKSSKKSKEKSRHESKEDKKRKRKSDDPKPGEATGTETKLQDNGVSSSLGGEAIVGEGEVGGETASGEGSAEGLTADYMLQLKELQHRIMTIQCNAELERVVNLIAATGKYEVTKKTFDFDLCLLDRSTVQRLIELIGQTRT